VLGGDRIRKIRKFICSRRKTRAAHMLGDPQADVFQKDARRIADALRLRSAPALHAVAADIGDRVFGMLTLDSVAGGALGPTLAQWIDGGAAREKSRP